MVLNSFRFGDGFRILSKMIDALPTYMKTTYELKEVGFVRYVNLKCSQLFIFSCKSLKK